MRKSGKSIAADARGAFPRRRPDRRPLQRKGSTATSKSNKSLEGLLAKATDVGAHNAGCLGPTLAHASGLIHSDNSQIARSSSSSRHESRNCRQRHAADRHRLEAIVADRSAPQKQVWRANIILATADGCGTAEIMRRSGKSKPVVWTWQARFMAEGVAGLTRDKTRKPGKPPLPAGTVQRVVDLALGPPPGEATHWTGRMLAKAAGVSLRSVQRILEAHQLAPHRIRTFKLSNDPKFAEKLKDIVGLYVDPPAHAVVLSVDEKSQIQALDRSQPGLPMKPGRAGTMTHDYKRHGTTTLFAALNILDGTVIGRNIKRHRHQEFIRFLDAIEAQVPRRKAIHAIVDNVEIVNHGSSFDYLRPCRFGLFPLIEHEMRGRPCVAVGFQGLRGHWTAAMIPR